MSFNFGNTSASTLGPTSTPAKPGTGFGNFSFGGVSTAAPAFGNTPTTAAPAFGTTAFGSAFGATTAVPTLGGFSGFGTTTSTAPSVFGGLGVSTASGFSGFGAQTTTTPAFGSFGTTTSVAPTFGGFGAIGTTTTTAPSFGGFGTAATTNPGFPGFGTSFGSTFGKPTVSAASAFGSFGTPFGQQLQPAQQPSSQLSSDEAFALSIFNVSIYGDERDTIIAKWNYLQAMWGSGKSFYSSTAAAVDIEPQNYLCRFKTMGYSRLPGKDNKMGLVSLILKKTFTEVKTNQQPFITQLNQIFGSKPNLVINIESLRQLSESKTQLIIYVEEKSQQNPNEIKRILATELSNFLNHVNNKTQLNNMGIEQVLALVLPDEDQLKEYFENPPKGIDSRMWRQAKIDNPDPKKFIPVPMVGFNDLKWRIKCQDEETKTHVQYLSKVEKDLAELKQRHAATTAKIMEHKRKLAELSHRILKVIVKQESTRKVGIALSPEEDTLRSKMENMQAVVSAPTQFKGRLSELLSQMRMQRNQWSTSASNEYTLDKDSEEEMKAFLTMQQKAMEFLIETVNKDMKSLEIISDGMARLTRG